MHPISDDYFSYNLSPHFSLKIKQDPETTCIIMKMLSGVLNTKDLPLTYNILAEKLPSILISDCFNDKNLAFSQEVKETEIGHLFEHILLEYLCLLKIDQGFEEAEFCGTTNWDWQHDERGTFHITIDSGLNNSSIFLEAVNLTINLMTAILNSNLAKSEAEPASSLPRTLL